MLPLVVPFLPHTNYTFKQYFQEPFSPQNLGYYPKNPENVDPSLQVRIIPNWWHGLTVEIYPSAGSSYTSFGIYYSISENGPYELVTPGYITSLAYTFTGNKVNLKYNQPFIFIEAQGPNGVFVSPLATYFNKRAPALVQNAALDLTRREWIFLRKLSGVPSLIFKRRISGKRCPVCWDVQYQKIMSDHCSSCYNTSFEGGYYPPVYSLAQFDPLRKAEVNSEIGRTEPSSLQAWTINFPIINPKDLIYRIPDGKMFVVNDISNTEMQATVVRQLLDLMELDKEMVEYHLALSIPSFSYLSQIMSRENPWLNPTNTPDVNPAAFTGSTMDLNAVPTF